MLGLMFAGSALKVFGNILGAASANNNLRKEMEFNQQSFDLQTRQLADQKSFMNSRYDNQVGDMKSAMNVNAGASGFNQNYGSMGAVKNRQEGLINEERDYENRQLDFRQQGLDLDLAQQRWESDAKRKSNTANAFFGSAGETLSFLGSGVEADWWS